MSSSPANKPAPRAPVPSYNLGVCRTESGDCFRLATCRLRLPASVQDAIRKGWLAKMEEAVTTAWYSARHTEADYAPIWDKDGRLYLCDDCTRTYCQKYRALFDADRPPAPEPARKPRAKPTGAILTLDGLMPNEPSINVRVRGRGGKSPMAVKQALTRAGLGHIDEVIFMRSEDGSTHLRVHFGEWATGTGVDAVRLALLNKLRPRLYAHGRGRSFWKLSVTNRAYTPEGPAPEVPRMEVELEDDAYAVIGSS